METVQRENSGKRLRLEDKEKKKIESTLEDVETYEDEIIADDDPEGEESLYYKNIDNNDIGVLTNKIKDKEKLLKELNEELNKLKKEGFISYDTCVKLFKKIDKNSNGIISKAELSKYLKLLHKKFNDEEPLERIDELFLKHTNLKLGETLYGPDQVSYELADIQKLFPDLENRGTDGADGINLIQFLKFMYSNNITSKEILLLKKIISIAREKIKYEIIQYELRGIKDTVLILKVNILILNFFENFLDDLQKDAETFKTVISDFDNLYLIELNKILSSKSNIDFEYRYMRFNRDTINFLYDEDKVALAQILETHAQELVNAISPGKNLNLIQLAGIHIQALIIKEQAHALANQELTPVANEGNSIYSLTYKLIMEEYQKLVPAISKANKVKEQTETERLALKQAVTETQALAQTETETQALNQAVTETLALAQAQAEEAQAQAEQALAAQAVATQELTEAVKADKITLEARVEKAKLTALAAQAAQAAQEAQAAQAAQEKLANAQEKLEALTQAETALAALTQAEATYAALTQAETALAALTQAEATQAETELKKTADQATQKAQNHAHLMVQKVREAQQAAENAEVKLEKAKGLYAYPAYYIINILAKKLAQHFTQTDDTTPIILTEYDKNIALLVQKIAEHLVKKLQTEKTKEMTDDEGASGSPAASGASVDPKEELRIQDIINEINNTELFYLKNLRKILGILHNFIYTQCSGDGKLLLIDNIFALKLESIKKEFEIEVEIQNLIENNEPKQLTTSTDPDSSMSGTATPLLNEVPRREEQGQGNGTTKYEQREGDNHGEGMQVDASATPGYVGMPLYGGKKQKQKKKKSKKGEILTFKF